MEKHISRTLSYILRHGAEKEGIPISYDGYVHVRDIQDYYRKTTGNAPTLETLEHVVLTNDKQRFHLEGTRIRANQGHSKNLSVAVPMHKVQTYSEIPVVLHGSYKKYKWSIKKDGLSRMSRQHIHCATSKDTVSGMRKDCDMIIRIDARKAMEQGIEFYISQNGVILTEGLDGIIPSKFLSFEECQTVTGSTRSKIKKIVGEMIPQPN